MLVAVAFAATTLFTESPGVALASCQPGRTPHDNVARHVGTKAAKSSLTGIKSSIEEYDPFYSGYNGAGTNASVLLVKWNPTQWAQMGWLKAEVHNPPQTTRDTFVEIYVSASNNRYYWWPAEPAGSSTAYRIYHNGGNDLTFFEDGVQVLHTASGIPQPTEYQIFAETHDRVDQMPGGTSAHLTLSVSRYYTGSSHTAATVQSGTFNEQSLYYGVSTDGAGNYEVWDKECGS